MTDIEDLYYKRSLVIRNLSGFKAINLKIYPFLRVGIVVGPGLFEFKLLNDTLPASQFDRNLSLEDRVS